MGQLGIDGVDLLHIQQLVAPSLGVAVPDPSQRVFNVDTVTLDFYVVQLEVLVVFDGRVLDFFKVGMIHDQSADVSDQVAVVQEIQ